MASHPYRVTKPAPNVGWIMCADLKGGWTNFSSKMREVQPHGVLHETTIYDNGRGYTTRGSKMIRLANGSLIVGKSGSQEQMALTGATIDWLAVDELPKIGHFGEARSRVAVNEAPIFMAFTPIGRPATWLRNWVEGNPDTGDPAQEDWDIHRIKLTPENCPHRSAESIEKQIRGYGPWEYAQRVAGTTASSLARRSATWWAMEAIGCGSWTSTSPRSATHLQQRPGPSRRCSGAGA